MIKKTIAALVVVIPFIWASNLDGGERDKMVAANGMEFVWIPPGTYTMGSPADEPDRGDDERQHKVTLSKGFFMQRTEVTQKQWKAIMGSNPSFFKKCGDDCPVEQVSWDNTQEFIAKLNQHDADGKYRLPTEAEWEYAARAGSTTRFAYGDDATKLSEYAWHDGNAKERVHPVAQKKPNAWGLYDMHGNAWEWCHDWYSSRYPKRTTVDPTGKPSGKARVIRGGGWCSQARGVRCSRRSSLSPDKGYNSIGFRLVMVPAEGEL